ncbi:MAG: protein kinase [Thermaerobacter sp.]|nr:protein kinase [Thermaerobacter sp.]
MSGSKSQASSYGYVFSKAGRRLPVGQRIAEGGEGTVYRVADQATVCIKIFHRKELEDKEREEKLRAMVEHPPEDPMARQGHCSIAWPREQIFADAAKKRFLGFLMPLVPRGALPALACMQPEDRNRRLAEFNFKYLVQASRNLAAAMAAVHQVDCVVGDLNESNVMVHPKALITVIDCDSLQVRRNGRVWRCQVAKREYLAPELQGQDLAAVDRTEASDSFALAVMIFQLLMQGFHPFMGVWRGQGEAPSLADRIRDHLYAYQGGSLKPPPAAPALEILPPAVRQAFGQAFAGAPQDRPTPKDWMRLMDDMFGKLQVCPRESQHVYGTHQAHCPWCRMAQEGRQFFAPAPVRQVALPPAGQAAGPGRTSLGDVAVSSLGLTFSDLEARGPAKELILTVHNRSRQPFQADVTLQPQGTATVAFQVVPERIYLRNFNSVAVVKVTADPVHASPGMHQAQLFIKGQLGASPWERQVSILAEVRPRRGQVATGRVPASPVDLRGRFGERQTAVLVAFAVAVAGWVQTYQPPRPLLGLLDMAMGWLASDFMNPVFLWLGLAVLVLVSATLGGAGFRLPKGWLCSSLAATVTLAALAWYFPIMSAVSRFVVPGLLAGGALAAAVYVGAGILRRHLPETLPVGVRAATVLLLALGLYLGAWAGAKGVSAHLVRQARGELSGFWVGTLGGKPVDLEVKVDGSRVSGFFSRLDQREVVAGRIRSDGSVRLDSTALRGPSAGLRPGVFNGYLGTSRHLMGSWQAAGGDGYLLWRVRRVSRSSAPAS